MEVADCVADPLDDCSQMQPAKLLPPLEKDEAEKGYEPCTMLGAERKKKEVSSLSKPHTRIQPLQFLMHPMLHNGFFW